MSIFMDRTTSLRISSNRSKLGVDVGIVTFFRVESLTEMPIGASAATYLRQIFFATNLRYSGASIVL